MAADGPEGRRCYPKYAMRWSTSLILLLLPACGQDTAPEVEVPSWAHVAPEQIAEAKKHGVPVAFENDLEALLMLRRFVSFLPSNNQEKPPVWPNQDPAGRIDMSLDTLIPDDVNKPYDMKEIIYKIADNEEFLEVHVYYAKNIISSLHCSTFFL